MGLFSKKTPETAISTHSHGDNNPLAGVSVIDGRYDFGAGVNDNSEIEDSGTRDRVEEAVRRLYSDEKFHSHIVGLLSWVGEKKQLNSLQVSPDDDSFRAACDVIYRRLMDGPMGPLLDRLGDQALLDIIVVTGGFGPLFVGTAAEIRARKKMAQNDNEETINE